MVVSPPLCVWKNALFEVISWKIYNFSLLEPKDLNISTNHYFGIGTTNMKKKISISRKTGGIELLSSSAIKTKTTPGCELLCKKEKQRPGKVILLSILPFISLPLSIDTINLLSINIIEFTFAFFVFLLVPFYLIFVRHLYVKKL